MSARRLLASPAAALLALGLGCSPPSPPPGVAPPPQASAAPSAEAPRPAAPETPDDDFRKAPPPVAAPSPVVPPKIEEQRLGSGLRALLLERHELPVVAMQLVVPWGPKPTPPGAAALLGTQLMSRPSRKGPSYQEAFEGLGADISGSMDADGLRVTLTTTSPMFEPTLLLLGELLQDTRYEKAPVEKARAERVEWLKEHGPRETDGARAPELLLAPQSPYRSSFFGTPESEKSITEKDLTRLHEERIVASRSTIAVVGDVRPAPLLATLGRAFGAWKSGAPPGALPPGPKGLVAGVQVSDNGQDPALVTLGLPSVTRASRDQVAIEAALSILSSHIARRLVEQNPMGWLRNFDWNTHRYPGVYSLTIEIVSASAPGALEILLDEARKIEVGGFDDEELAGAVKGMADALYGRFDRSVDAAWAVGDIGLFDLPLDVYAREVAEIGSLGKAEVKEAARVFFAKDQLRALVWGDASAMTDKLGKLGLGKVLVRPALNKKAKEPGKKGKR